MADETGMMGLDEARKLLQQMNIAREQLALAKGQAKQEKIAGEIDALAARLTAGGRSWDGGLDGRWFELILTPEEEAAEQASAEARIARLIEQAIAEQERRERVLAAAQAVALGAEHEELWRAYEALLSAEIRDALPDAQVRRYGDHAAVMFTHSGWKFALERQRLVEGSYTWRLAVVSSPGHGYRFIEDDDNTSHAFLLALDALVKENRL